MGRSLSKLVWLCSLQVWACSDPNLKQRSKPSDETEALPGYVASDEASAAAGAGVEITLEDAYIIVPPHSISTNYTVRLQSYLELPEAFQEEEAVTLSQPLSRSVLKIDIYDSQDLVTLSSSDLELPHKIVHTDVGDLPDDHEVAALVALDYGDMGKEVALISDVTVEYGTSLTESKAILSIELNSKLTSGYIVFVSYPKANASVLTIQQSSQIDTSGGGQIEVVETGGDEGNTNENSGTDPVLPAPVYKDIVDLYTIQNTGWINQPGQFFGNFLAKGATTDSHLTLVRNGQLETYDSFPIRVPTVAEGDAFETSSGWTLVASHDWSAGNYHLSFLRDGNAEPQHSHLINSSSLAGTLAGDEFLILRDNEGAIEYAKTTTTAGSPPSWGSYQSVLTLDAGSNYFDIHDGKLGALIIIETEASPNITLRAVYLKSDGTSTAPLLIIENVHYSSYQHRVYALPNGDFILWDQDEGDPTSISYRIFSATSLTWSNRTTLTSLPFEGSPDRWDVFSNDGDEMVFFLASGADGVIKLYDMNTGWGEEYALPCEIQTDMYLDLGLLDDDSALMVLGYASAGSRQNCTSSSNYAVNALTWTRAEGFGEPLLISENYYALSLLYVYTARDGTGAVLFREGSSASGPKTYRYLPYERP